MLLRFQFSNFRSFQGEQELSLVPVLFKGQMESDRGNSALSVAAVYGANASGKTNVLRALEFMKTAVVESHSSWKPDGGIPRQAFAGADDSRPSRFVVDFELDGIRHQFGFAVTSMAVEEEWLHVFPKGKRQVWYSRRPGGGLAFGTKLKGEKETIRALTRRNSLFLSVAAQNNHEQLSQVYRWFSSHVLFVNSHSELRPHRVWQFDGSALPEHCWNDLKKADLGIVGVNWSLEPDQTTRVRLVHRVGDEQVPFDKEQESTGTLAYLTFLGAIEETLATGGLLCIDELDSSLHPLLAAELIRLFHEPANAEHPAQLIFTAHNTNLMRSLRRDQIWFTEKDNSGASRLYPLSDFKPRRQENLELGYVQGRYGAIPLIESGFPSPRTGEANDAP